MSRARAEKMATEFFAAYNRAGQNPSKIDAFARLGAPSCKGCAALKKDLLKRRKSGARATGKEADVLRMAAQPDGAPDKWAVPLTLRQNAVEVVDRAGRRIESIPLVTDDKILELGYVNGEWKITATKKLVGGF